MALSDDADASEATEPPYAAYGSGGAADDYTVPPYAAYGFGAGAVAVAF